MSNKKMLMESTKKGLMDCVIYGDMNVENPISMIEMIEEIPSEQWETLYESFLLGTESESKQILDSLYSEYLKENNSTDVVIESQNIWDKKRNQILLQEADDGGMSQESFNKSLYIMSATLSVPKLIEYALATKAKHPELSIRTAVNGIKQSVPKKYNALKQKEIWKQILPSFEKSPEKLKKMADKKAKLAAAGKPTTTVGKVDKALEAIKKGAKSPTIWYILATAGGLVAASTGLHYVYDRYLSDGAKACEGKRRKERTACLLKFKIAGCQKAIKAAEIMKQGCDKKNDPGKCRYSFQQKIWQWTKRKQKYQEKLSKLAVQKNNQLRK